MLYNFLHNPAHDQNLHQKLDSIQNHISISIVPSTRATPSTRM